MKVNGFVYQEIHQKMVDLKVDHVFQWKLIKPLIYYDGLNFDLEYTTSDYIQTNMVKYTLYDGHTACETNNGNNIINDSGCFTIELVGDDTPVGGGLETRQMTLSTLIDPNTIRDSPSYEESEDGTSATIKFCVRLGVHDGEQSKRKVEISPLKLQLMSRCTVLE